MKFHNWILTPLFVVPSAHAATTMREACTTEISKFQCEAISESYAYDCLTKNREQRTKNKGFSRKCYKAYAAFEQSKGGGEKIESHQIENPEHQK